MKKKFFQLLEIVVLGAISPFVAVGVYVGIHFFASLLIWGIGGVALVAVFFAPYVAGLVFFVSLAVVSFFLVKRGRRPVFVVGVVLCSILLGLAFIAVSLTPGIISTLLQEQQTRHLYREKIIAGDDGEEEVVCYLDSAQDSEYVNEELGYRIELPAGWRWKGAPLDVGCEGEYEGGGHYYKLDGIGGGYDTENVLTPVITKGDVFIVFEIKKNPFPVNIAKVESYLQSEGMFDVEQYKKKEGLLHIGKRNILFVTTSLFDIPTVYVLDGQDQIMFRIMLRAIGEFKESINFMDQAYFDHEADFLEGLEGLHLIE